MDNYQKYHAVRKLYGTKIEIPDNLIEKNVQGDTLSQNSGEWYTSIIIWYDSTRCASCHLHTIERWNKLFQFAKDSVKGIKPMIIFSPGKNELYKFESNLRATDFKYPIYVDYDGYFGSRNPMINSFKYQAVFLTDKNQNIVLVGDPYYNTQMLKLYKETMSKLIENNGLLSE